MKLLDSVLQRMSQNPEYVQMLVMELWKSVFRDIYLVAEAKGLLQSTEIQRFHRVSEDPNY